MTADKKPYLAPFKETDVLVIKPAKNGGYVVEVSLERTMVPEQNAFTNSADLLVALQAAFGDRP